MRELTPCAIALGSNLGDSKAILDGAIVCLKSLPQVDIIAVSSWSITAAVGPPQPDYLNGCVTIFTSLSPVELLQALQSIEQQFDRVRTEKWGARTLDLDLILYGDRLIDSIDLQVPHPLMPQRAFVLTPLCEIAPEWIDPRTGKSIAAIARELVISSDPMNS